VALKEVGRLDRIVRDLLLFARSRQLHPVACDLLELSESVLHVLKPQCEDLGVRVHLVRQSVPAVFVDVAQMEQVLLNLFLNALQAMPDGGILTVTCQLLQLPAWEQSERCATQPLPASEERPADAEQPKAEIWERQAWLDLTVSDTGEGISQEALERIFQPFYTTKAHGIGLGLPITRRLVEDHRGYLLVESQLGYGTAISVRLPLDTTVLDEQNWRGEEGTAQHEFDNPDC
jgi:signal transduction histidine kinase